MEVRSSITILEILKPFLWREEDILVMNAVLEWIHEWPFTMSAKRFSAIRSNARAARWTEERKHLDTLDGWTGQGECLG